MEGGFGVIWQILGTLTDGTSIYVIVDELSHARPPILTFDQVKHFDVAWVSCGCGIMSEGGDKSSKVSIFREANESGVQDQPFVHAPMRLEHVLPLAGTVCLDCL